MTRNNAASGTSGSCLFVLVSISMLVGLFFRSSIYSFLKIEPGILKTLITIVLSIGGIIGGSFIILFLIGLIRAGRNTRLGTETGEMPTEVYITEPYVGAMDKAHKIILTEVLTIINERLYNSKITPEFRQRANHIAGVYEQCFTKNRRGLEHLLAARKNLHRQIKWEMNPAGDYRSNEINSLDEDGGFDALTEASVAITEYIESWQPLMDSIAAIIQTLLETDTDHIYKKSDSLFQLSKILSEDLNLPTKTYLLKEAVTTKAEWYLNDIRPMRNRLVHNERIATLVPYPQENSLRTIVELKELFAEDTSQKLDLDQFLYWSTGKYFLFCLAISEGSKTLVN